MIDLYTWTTPNGRKIPIALEEMGLEYRVHPVDIGQNQQFAPDFLSISPNNKIPAIVDHDAPDGPQSVFESGAILVYLAEKTGKLLAPSGPVRVAALEWTFWQVGGLGPMAGQLGYFALRAPEPIELAIDRFADEVRRLLGVMEGRLEKVRYLAGADYSIADIASFAWTKAALETLEKIQPDRPAPAGGARLAGAGRRTGRRAAGHGRAEGVALGRRALLGGLDLGGQHVDQLDAEDHHAVAGDRALVLGAVAQFRGYVEGPFVARAHHDQGFLPGRHQALQRERGGGAALVGAVEHRAVDQLALVVDLDLVGRVRLGAVGRTRADDLVLQAVGQGDDAGLLGVLNHERLGGGQAFLLLLAGTAGGQGQGRAERDGKEEFGGEGESQGADHGTTNSDEHSSVLDQFAPARAPIFGRPGFEADRHRTVVAPDRGAP
jgi:GST-like protein